LKTPANVGRKSRYGVETVAEPIEDIRRIIERWGEKLVPHQDANSQIKRHLILKCSQVPLPALERVRMAA
jgi:hypothetical protein